MNVVSQMPKTTTLSVHRPPDNGYRCLKNIPLPVIITVDCSHDVHFTCLFGFVKLIMFLVAHPSFPNSGPLPPSPFTPKGDHSTFSNPSGMNPDPSTPYRESTSFSSPSGINSAGRGLKPNNDSYVNSALKRGVNVLFKYGL